MKVANSSMSHNADVSHLRRRPRAGACTRGVCGVSLDGPKESRGAGRRPRLHRGDVRGRTAVTRGDGAGAPPYIMQSLKRHDEAWGNTEFQHGGSGQLLDCELVVSTSLHGLIFAEAFGIPARWVRDTTFPSKRNDVFKFNDHLLSTGRPANLYASSMEEAVRMGGMPPIGKATLRCRQRALMLAFPFHVRTCPPAQGGVNVGREPIFDKESVEFTTSTTTEKFF